MLVGVAYHATQINIKKGVIIMAEFSPMMQHYLQTKEEYKDCILFYRLGDFYEMFFDDAITASREREENVGKKNVLLCVGFLFMQQRYIQQD